MAKAYVAKLAHLCWHCHGPDQAKCLQSTREGPNLKFKSVNSSNKMHNKVQHRICSRNRVSSDRVSCMKASSSSSSAEYLNIFCHMIDNFLPSPCHPHIKNNYYFFRTVALSECRETVGGFIQAETAPCRRRDWCIDDYQWDGELLGNSHQLAPVYQQMKYHMHT